MNTKREPTAAGTFYENDPQKLKDQLFELFNDSNKPVTSKKIRALILPHAGYIFSGRTAASGINQINPKAIYNNIFLIGSSHRMGYDGASVFKGSHFNTPLGSIAVDTNIAHELILKSSYFSFSQKPHKNEHSLEVQLPFLQYHLKEDFKIVPILIGTRDYNTCKEIATILKPYFTADNLFLISTDFSHYPDYEDAVSVDKETAKAIISNNTDTFLKVLSSYKASKIRGLSTPLCGWSSVLTLLYLTEQHYNFLEYKHIHYENSGDSIFGDKSGVVGYHAILVKEKNHES